LGNVYDKPVELRAAQISINPVGKAIRRSFDEYQEIETNTQFTLKGERQTNFTFTL